MTKFRIVSGFKIMFANVQSIFSKFDEFLANIFLGNPDIAGVAETWFHNEVSNSEIQVSRYVYNF